MALDHYVSQVHLRNFHAPALGKMLHAIRKPDMKSFPCRTCDVCRLDEGNTNEYLKEPRIIEEFLTSVEPKYNESVEKLRTNTIDDDAIYVIAGFASYVATCSPAAMRVNTGPIKGTIEATANMLDQRGVLPKAPEELGGKTLSELLAEGTVAIKIDGKYPQAIGITNIMGRVHAFGNFDWDILINEEAESPFFTSDYPIAIETAADPRVLNRIVPLAPDIAIRIRPDVNRKKPDVFSFPNFRSRHRKVRPAEIREINRLIVQSAESLVFFRDNHEWVSRFVQRHRWYRVEPIVRRIPRDKGEIILTRLELREHQPVIG
jgi:hypothetical protein